MSALASISLPILPNHHYHIYNRGNEKRPICFTDENYRYFLSRYGDYTDHYFDTYSYCILFNHYHLLIKPKPSDEVLETALRDFTTIDALFFSRYAKPWLRSIGIDPDRADLTVLRELLNLLERNPPHSTYNPPIDPHPTSMDELDFKTQLCSWILSERLRRFMLSYAKSINKERERTGSLFQKPFRRKYITSIPDLKMVSAYIHHNVIHHKCSTDLSDYTWSSYNSIIQEYNTRLAKTELLEWYGGKDAFIKYCEKYRQHKWELEKFYIEES